MSETNSFSIEVVIAQIKQIITDPVGFYKNMPKTGGYGEPIIFILVSAFAGGVVYAGLSIIGLAPGPGFGMGIGAIIAFPIGGVIGSFILAAILFVIWKLMGSPENYEAAYRGVAYSFGLMPALALCMVIPYLGTVIRIAWSTWLVIIQSTEVHGRAKQTATIVFGILATLMVFSGLSAEYASRQALEKVDEIRESLSEAQSNALENLENMSSEEMGRAVGDFMKGLQEAAEQSEGNQ